MKRAQCEEVELVWVGLVPLERNSRAVSDMARKEPFFFFL